MSRNNRRTRSQSSHGSPTHTPYTEAPPSQPPYPGGWTEVAKAVGKDMQRGVVLGNLARVLLQESNSPVIDSLSMVTWGLWGAGSYCAMKFLMGHYGKIYRGEESSNLLNRNADLWRRLSEYRQGREEQSQSLSTYPQ